jgi:UDP-N-acetyl-D-mannosaminuronic acid dehydrogenase
MTTTARTAELVKLAENAYRDVNIAFANELSLISAELGIDVWEVIALANRHPRVDILRPGPGVGGHCIAVDPWFIVASAPKVTRLIPQAREVNENKQQWVVRQIRDAADALGSPTIACLGLAYKADVDDLRESPALEITSQLAREYRGRLVVVEPNIGELPEPLRGRSGISFAAQAEPAIALAELVVLLVDHAEFRRLDLSRLAGKTVIDTRNCWPALRQR